MYLEYYGLKEPPFSITPDPRFVFLSERHRDALAHLLYGIGQGGGGGFVQLTGEVGTGKTTLCRLLLEQLPENTRIALVLNPKISPLELLETICEELKLDIEGRQGSLKGMVDRLNAYLLEAYAQGLRVVLIIDEAQNLSSDALEQVRLLTNLETPTQKLLQIILLGQPELRELLARPELRQLAQRITARYHLTPLSGDDTDAYLRHRLAVAGCNRFPFTKLAVKRLHEHAGGVPRLINVIADRALMAGYAQNLQQIGERTVDLAASEAMASPIRRIRAPGVTVWVGLLLATLLALWLWPREVDTGQAREAAENPPEEDEVAAPSSEEDSEAPLALAALRGRLRDAESSSVTAWNQLLSLWTLRAEDVDVRTAQRCPPVLAPGVYCLRSSGSLSKLATLGRPVVLRLSSEGRDAWAVLLGLSGTRARLGLDGETFDVTRRTLERAWLGEYFALWKAPEFMSGVIRGGESGPPVEWLRSVLTQRERQQSVEGPAYFDESMVNDVRRVQASHGLVPDGVVGPETLFALVSRERDGPRLRSQL